MGTVYAMTLDDLDICQMLPVRGDQFDQGVSIFGAPACTWSLC